MSSFTSFPPTSLVLSALSPSLYKLVLAYAVPVYPKHWTVGATELIITGSVGPLNSWPTRSSSSVFSPTFSPGPSVPMTVVATRTVRGVDVPAGWIDVTKLRQMREQWDRKVLRVSDAQTDGKWLVLAAGDVPPSMFSSSASDSDLPHSRSTSSMHSSSTLQLYRLSFSPPSPSIASPPPKLVFIRNLYGQTGPTAALAVADGRCVSLSANGSIWVWDLEGGGSAEVAPPDPARTAEDVQGLIAFDERRIITTGASGVVVRRFDI
ncbi:hypothetical protein AX16_010616 [Volvariella volvacea WC 439]|nr:hypothetical protein AX16_010616 [Volvariella volvacea WC 439]